MGMTVNLKKSIIQARQESRGFSFSWYLKKTEVFGFSSVTIPPLHWPVLLCENEDIETLELDVVAIELSFLSEIFSIFSLTALSLAQELNTRSLSVERTCNAPY